MQSIPHTIPCHTKLHRQHYAALRSGKITPVQQLSELETDDLKGLGISMAHAVVMLLEFGVN